MIHNDDHTSNCRDALSQLLWVTSLMSADMQRGLAERGLTETRAHVLWVLGGAERLTQRDLAAALRVTPRNVTTLIDALEETGFVRREAHPTDRRAVEIALTPKGQQAVAKLQSEMTEFAELLFAKLPERDLKIFRHILQDVGTRLSELAPDGAARKR